MNSNLSMMRSIVVAATLAAGVSGLARADDSSMNPFTGDSYASFNGGHLPTTGNPVFDKAPSAWRQANPNGQPEFFYQTSSAWGLAWKPTPVFAKAPSDPTFQQTHPNGLTESELQALSSEGPAWHQPDQSATSALASTNGATNMPSDSSEPLGARLARFFHVTPAKQATPVN